MTHVIVDDTSTDLDAVRADLRFELIVLHTEVKKFDPRWDFTAVVNLMSNYCWTIRDLQYLAFRELRSRLNG